MEAVSNVRSNEKTSQVYGEMFLCPLGPTSQENANTQLANTANTQLALT